MENLERISLDKNYLENLVFKLNHSLNSSSPDLKNSGSPVKDGLEPSQVCSEFFKYSTETIVSILKSFLSALATKKGIERNLLIRRGVKEIIYSKENIKIILFYLENLKDFQVSDNKQNPALLSQGRVKFSGRSEVSSLPPQENKFATSLRVWLYNSARTYFIKNS